MPAIRILVVDDHEVVQANIVSMFVADGIKVVGQANSAVEAIRLHGDIRPDVTLLDTRLPDADGFATLNAIRSSDPAARILMLSADFSQPNIALAQKVGACGYLTKAASREDMTLAIRQAVQTGKCTPFAPCQQHNIPETPKLALTERELDVLSHMRRGLSNSDIGKVLDISEQTVKSHVASVLKRLHAASRAEAVAIGYEMGLFRSSLSDGDSQKRSAPFSDTRFPFGRYPPFGG